MPIAVILLLLSTDSFHSNVLVQTMGVRTASAAGVSLPPRRQRARHLGSSPLPTTPAHQDIHELDDLAGSVGIEVEPDIDLPSIDLMGSSISLTLTKIECKRFGVNAFSLSPPHAKSINEVRSEVSASIDLHCALDVKAGVLGTLSISTSVHGLAFDIGATFTSEDFSTTAPHSVAVECLHRGATSSNEGDKSHSFRFDSVDVSVDEVGTHALVLTKSLLLLIPHIL